MHHCKCLPTHGTASHCGTRTQSSRHVHAIKQYKTGCFFFPFQSLSLLLSLLYFKKIQTFCRAFQDFSTWEVGARSRSSGGSRVKRGSWQQRWAEFSTQHNKENTLFPPLISLRAGFSFLALTVLLTCVKSFKERHRIRRNVSLWLGFQGSSHKYRRPSYHFPFPPQN